MSAPPTDPRLLVSPTAFKGTLSPHEAARAIAAGFRPFARSIRVLPLADGGDGTLDVLMGAFHGTRRKTRVTGPLGKPVTAEWGIVRRVPGLPGPTAVIEMARASGIALTKGRNRVMKATSRGTGELIRAAIRSGCRSVMMGVGGTATADGGAGALAGLGFKYFDADDRELPPDPISMMRLVRIDRASVEPGLRRTTIVVLCDVKNPLLGPRGSARTFGPQKGATPADVKRLERFSRHWSRFAVRQTKDRPGAGAAGATAYGLSAFAGARLVDGCSFILKAVGWMAEARKADLIVTGEGRIDRTSFSGKVAGEVARRRGRAVAAAVCGSTPMAARELRRRGLVAVETLGTAGLRRPFETLERAARRLANDLIQKS